MKLTEAQRYALLEQTEFHRREKGRIVLLTGSRGAHAATVRKLSEFGYLTDKFDVWGRFLSAAGEKAADELLAPQTLREKLTADAERLADIKRQQEQSRQREAEVARLVAERLPGDVPEYDYDLDAEDGYLSLRQYLAQGEEYGRPIGQVELSVRQLAQLLGIEVPEEVKVK